MREEKSKMIRKEKEGIEWLEFELLQEFPEVKHAVFLKGSYFDLREEKNQKKILEILKIKQGVKLWQCHKSEIVEAKKEREEWVLKNDFDGVVTKERGLGLLVRHADCQAALLYDPVKKAIGNIHSGWRGSVLNIYQKSILLMGSLYGSVPKDIRVCISPSLGPEAAEFIHFQKELPESFWKYQVKPTYFDFWAISKNQLMEEGILEENIEIARICTYSNQKDCFSYRRDKLTGHHGTCIALAN